MLITLPSGLSGEARGLTGKEAHQLADPTLARTGGSVDAMLKNCFLEIVEPGPYPWDVGAKPDWKKVLLGDRFAALIDIRALSFGSTYEFSLQCTAQGCGERYEWELELKDLPRRTLPEASIEQIREGNRFTTELADGREVLFKLANGEDEHAMAQQRRRNRGAWSAIDALAIQVQSIGGKRAPADIRDALEALPWSEVRDLQDAMQLVDCGVDTTIETECPFCKWVQEVNLPFEATFFLPRRKKGTAPSASPTKTATNGRPASP